MQLIEYLFQLNKRAAAYAALPMQPLKIEVVLRDAVMNFDNLHMDAILCSAVSEDILRGSPFPGGQSYVHVPAPLRILWKNDRSIPLYASTDLMHYGERISDSIFFHMRALEAAVTRESLNTTSGRFKEKRSAMPVAANREWDALVYGNAEEISRLLETVSSIGKKRSSLGAVDHWTVTPVERFSLVDEHNHALRPLPMQWLFGGSYLMNTGTVEGFSSPYWHKSTHDLCIPYGDSANGAAVPLVYD